MFDIYELPYNPLRCQIDLKAFDMSPLVRWPSSMEVCHLKCRRLCWDAVWKSHARRWNVEAFGRIEKNVELPLESPEMQKWFWRFTRFFKEHKIRDLLVCSSSLGSDRPTGFYWQSPHNLPMSQYLGDPNFHAICQNRRCVRKRMMSHRPVSLHPELPPSYRVMEQTIVLWLFSFLLSSVPKSVYMR